MDAGLTRAEALALPLEELPGLLRAARLRRLDRLRERLWLLWLLRADASELDAAFRRLSREETALGRRPLSALHAASDPAVRARILDIRKGLNHERDADTRRRHCDPA
jgi:hypothetical protein